MPFKTICHKKLELKCKHKGSQATFVALNVTIEDEKPIYRLFKKRDGFPFCTVRTPDLTGNNIPSHVFYGSMMFEIMKIIHHLQQIFYQSGY